ncbi:MAG: ABC transporter permease [Acidobacteriota bacterium]
MTRDLRYAIRQLLRKPAFTAVAVLTLALGIGANAAIFSVVNSVLLRALPLGEPDRLIKLWETFTPGGQNQIFQGTVSVPNLKDWLEQNDVFSQIAVWQFSSFALQGEEHPERALGATVSANFFDVTGVAPAFGRGFAEGEDTAGRNRVVILSDKLWRRNFGADPQIVNRSITLGGETHTVIGVMPAWFQFPSVTTELWVPLVPTENQMRNRGNHWMFAMGRLKPSATLEQAQEQMSRIASRLAEQYPAEQAGRGIKLIPLEEETVQNARPALLVLLGAVAFVLLIACTNVANLLLVRAASRRKEIAIRASLGASRARLIRQFLTESALLALSGGALGLLLAQWSLDALLALAADWLPRASEVRLDWRVVGFTSLLSILTGILFGLAPALQSSKMDVQSALKESGTGGASARRNKLRSLLVVVEVASAIVLLVGAGLLIKSFLRLQQTDTGFRAENLLTMGISLPQAKYSTPQSVVAFYQQTLERIAALPGVESAGAINMLPIQQTGMNGDIEIEGQAPYPPGQAPLAEYRAVSPDYFRAMRIPLLAGRALDERDREKSAPVILVNKTLVDKFLDSENPLGRRIRAGSDEWGVVVGVVGDVKQSGITREVRPEIYFSYAQAGAFVRSMSVVVRSTLDTATLTAAVRREVQSVDAAQPIHNIQMMEAVIARSVSDRRLNMTLLSIFASVAVALAVIGIYSVMSYTVTQSTRDIGIRMALGAERSDIVRMVVGQGLSLTAIGAVAGVASSFALTRLIESLLFGVSATDAAIFAAVPALLIAVSALACFIPARRATRVDPMVALRCE